MQETPRIPPQKLKPLFSEEAAIEQAQYVELEIERLGTLAEKKGFEQLVTKQRQALNQIKEEQRRSRPEAIRLLAEEKLDTILKAQHPALRPRFLPSRSRKQEEFLARKDAESMIRRGEAMVLSEVEAKFLKERRQYMERIKCKAQFKAAAHDDAGGPDARSRGGSEISKTPPSKGRSR